MVFDNVGVPCTQTIDVAEIIKNSCSNLDSNIFMSALIVLSATIFFIAIFPRAKQIVNKFKDNKSIDNIFDILIGTSEMMLLMGALYIIGIYYYQGLITQRVWLWLIFMGVLVSISFLMNLPSTIEYIKKLIKDSNEGDDE